MRRLFTPTTLRLEWFFANGHLTSAWRAIEDQTRDADVPARAA
jgi:hypothetical protein